MSGGWLRVVGIGPAGAGWCTPETAAVLSAATDLVGYGPYLERAATGGQRHHASDNRAERDRAGHALELAAAGQRVAVVSGGDPGVFAMAAAVLEVLEARAAEFPAVDVEILPGVSAMQAAAARLGAPLGGDFCVLSLSDNLKPWSLITHRLRCAALGDFALALYNPISRARPWQLGEALDVVRAERAPDTAVVLARAVGRADERVTITTLDDVEPEAADMRTLVLVGASGTRVFSQGERQWVYTPRSCPAEAQ